MKQRNQENKKRGIIIVCIVTLISLAANLFFVIGGGYWDKISYRYFGKERSNFASNDSTVAGWTRSLEQMNYDADIVFFGDSITSQGRWQEWFPDRRIINLGVNGNALDDMDDRINLVYAVNPETIFIMGGINGITDISIEPYVKRYKKILNEIKENLPEAEVYIQSVLPISESEGRKINVSNKTICDFNVELQRLAEEFGWTYVNLFELYEKNGEMNPDFTKDGTHLRDEAYTFWVEAIRPYIDISTEE